MKNKETIRKHNEHSRKRITNKEKHKKYEQINEKQRETMNSDET